MRRSVASTLCAGVLVVAAHAAAEPAPSLAFDPAPAGDAALGVESADVRGAGLLRARLLGDYASEPLVLVRPDQRLDGVVERQIWLHALGSLALAHRLLVVLDVPFVVAADGAPATPASLPVPRAGGAKPGDLRLSGRLRLLGNPGTGLHAALAAAVWLPTGPSDGWTGDGALRGRAAAVVDGVHGAFAWSFEAGARSRPAVRLPGLLPTRVGSAVTLGAAAGWLFDAKRTLRLGPELRADLGVADGARLLDTRSSVVQALLAARFAPHAGDLEFLGGFGPGLASGAGNADWRALFAVGWSPEQKPPAPDRDDDGVADGIDACIALAGVAAADPAMNGCPEVPPDRDGDSIPDQYDACPLVAGVPTGFRRTHGCPEAVIAAEKKPPEVPPALIERHIAIEQQVQFETGRAVLLPASDAVLAGVAQVLKDHPEIELVEVQGHTDTTGTEVLNRELSESRAKAVVRWLVEHGIAAERLVARGYGYSRPVADESTEEGRRRNRRVDFVVQRLQGEKETP